jgi:hypothetical protein
MKIAVAANIVIDFIHDVKGRISRNLGGPACYCGLTARQFATTVGTDFVYVIRNFYMIMGLLSKRIRLLNILQNLKS